MKVLVVLALVAVAYARPDEEFYDTRYDNFNVNEVLENIRLLTSYCNCFTGGKCTPDGANFKKWMPEAVQSNCGKCTEKQKGLVAQVMMAIKEKLPEEWDKLLNIYDPEKKARDALPKFLETYGH